MDLRLTPRAQYFKSLKNYCETEKRLAWMGGKEGRRASDELLIGRAGGK